MCIKKKTVINRVGPDQMPHSAASDLDLHCLFRPVCPKLRVITTCVYIKTVIISVATDQTPRSGSTLFAQARVSLYVGFIFFAVVCPKRPKTKSQGEK